MAFWRFSLIKSRRGQPTRICRLRLCWQISGHTARRTSWSYGRNTHAHDLQSGAGRRPIHCYDTTGQASLFTNRTTRRERVARCCRKKNEEAWKHWTTVGSGRIEKSFQKLQPGDWVIYGDEEFFLPVGHKNRPPTSAGNESGKHSLIVLDITENGVLLGSGNAPSNENRGRTLDTRFFTWQKIGKNFDNRAAEVFRFTPQSDKVVKFEHEIYSGTGEFQANAVMGELLKELMIR